mgnify:CR=1 FL=1
MYFIMHLNQRQESGITKSAIYPSVSFARENALSIFFGNSTKSGHLRFVKESLSCPKLNGDSPLSNYFLQAILYEGVYHV